MNHINMLLTLISLTAFSALAQDPATTETKAEYVAINVEVKGLEAASEEFVHTLQTLTKLMEEMNQTVHEVHDSPDKLSPEQIRELTAMVAAVDKMILSAGEVVLSAEQTFEALEVPANQFVKDVILQANTDLVQPSIDRVLDEITIWRYALTGLISLIVVLLIYVLLTSRNLVTLIAGQYRLVHVSKLPDK